jgi:hypothetical protein
MSRRRRTKPSPEGEGIATVFLSDEQVAAWLQALTDKQLIEFFYKHLSARRIEGDGITEMDNHLALAEVTRLRDDSGGWRPWTVELLCTSPHPRAADNAPIMWRGECCGFQTASCRRFATCPVCGEEVRDA